MNIVVLLGGALNEMDGLGNHLSSKLSGRIQFHVSLHEVVSQSVKDVVQSLVDDDLVCTDKCGTQTLFWCLPSAAAQKVRMRILIESHFQLNR